MRGDLERLLYSKIEDRVEVRLGTSVDSLEQDGAKVRVKLTDGTTRSFDVLVGADGVHSRVRELAFGAEDSFSRFLGYYTAAFIVDDRRMREGLGEAFYTLTVPGRQVAVYPVRGGRLATFFIHKAGNELGDSSPDTIREELHRAYGGMGWIVPELLERCPYGGCTSTRLSRSKCPAGAGDAWCSSGTLAGASRYWQARELPWPCAVPTPWPRC
jgi:2-polyprenyl-6-methoxyphenol hydroxylase-like FAD-dependent oxidoreductase